MGSSQASSLYGAGQLTNMDNVYETTLVVSFFDASKRWSLYGTEFIDFNFLMCIRASLEQCSKHFCPFGKSPYNLGKNSVFLSDKICEKISHCWYFYIIA